MPARLANSAAPLNAITIWTDGRDLFYELPGPAAYPTIIRAPLNVAGLSSALHLISTRARYDSTTPPPAPIGKHGTSAQYDNARAALRELGLIR